MTIGTLVGMRTGPFTFRFFSLAPRIRSAQTKVKNKDQKKKTRQKRLKTVRVQHVRKSLLRIAYTCRQGASHGKFILIAQVSRKLLRPFAGLYLPFSRDLTLRLVRVMRMRWMATSVSTGALPVSLKAYMSGETTVLTHRHTKKNLTRLDCHELEPNFVTI